MMMADPAGVLAATLMPWRVWQAAADAFVGEDDGGEIAGAFDRETQLVGLRADVGESMA
jgi:hypothetical protein